MDRVLAEVHCGQWQCNDSGTQPDNPFFGKGGRPANPGIDASPQPRGAAVNSSLDALTSAAKSGRDAAKRPLEQAHNLASCASDKSACATPDPLTVPKIDGKPPGVTALIESIPSGQRERALNDPQIKMSLDWFQSREMDKSNARAQLAYLQQQVHNNGRDPAALRAQEQTLRYDLARIDRDQQTARNQIRRQLINLGIAFDESPRPKPGRATSR
jgi:hypothetical protein